MKTHETSVVCKTGRVECVHLAACFMEFRTCGNVPSIREGRGGGMEDDKTPVTGL